MKDNTQELLKKLKEAKNSDKYPYSEETTFEQSILLRCQLCGENKRINKATLFRWTNSQEKAGWVALCPVCGSRQLICFEEPLISGGNSGESRKNNNSKTKKSKFGKNFRWIIAILALFFVIRPIASSFLKNNFHSATVPTTSISSALEEIQNVLSSDNAESEENIDGTETSHNNNAVIADEEREKVSFYQVYWEDVNWSEAEERCESKEHNGVRGHLATITSQDEFDEVTDVLDTFIRKQKDKNAQKLNYVWLGGWIKNEDAKSYYNNYQWITGEEWVYDNWCHTIFKDSNGTNVLIDEPSFYDGDILENRLILWQLKKEELGWTFSDQDGNILDSYPASSGKIAYICEFDESEYK